MLMLGCRWSMMARAGRVFKLSGGGHAFELGEDYRECLNALEVQWLCRQPAVLKLPIFLAYEAGWNVE